MQTLSEETKTRVEGLMEVIMHVENMNVEVSFYRDKLGLGLTYPRDKVDFEKENWVTFDTGSCIFVLHSGGRIRTGESPSHRIVFRVRDIHATRNELVGRGLTLSEVRSPAPKVWVVDGRDPEGNVIALEEHG